MQGVASLCLELEKLKLVGNEPATLYDFAVLDALWSGIVQSPAAMQSFLLADGLGALLDVLDQGAAALQPLLLTIIAGKCFVHHRPALGMVAGTKAWLLMARHGC